MYILYTRVRARVRICDLISSQQIGNLLSKIIFKNFRIVCAF